MDQSTPHLGRCQLARWPMLIDSLKRSWSSRVEFTRRLASRPRSLKAGARSGRSGGEVFRRLAAAVKTEPGTGGRQRLANEVLVPALVILIGALLVALGIGVVKQFSGTDRAYTSQPSLQALSAPPAVAPVAAGGAQGKSRKAKRPERKAKRPEKKSTTPAAPVSEPSFVRAPTTKKRSPAPIQPASEPVASPAPSRATAARTILLRRCRSILLPSYSTASGTAKPRMALRRRADDRSASSLVSHKAIRSG